MMNIIIVYRYLHLTLKSYLSSFYFHIDPVGKGRHI